MIWEAALPPCVCAILTVVTYLTLVQSLSYTFDNPFELWCLQVDDNYWDLTFQAILGKLYVISLFVTLYDASRFLRHLSL